MSRKMNNQSRPSKEQEALRFFEGMPVEEAKADLLVIPTKRDIKGAVRADPRNCALSRACNRLYGSRAAIVFKRVAYIDLINEDGDRVVMRFKIRGKVWDAIVHFDETGEFPMNGFVFRRPTKSETLAAMSEYNKARNEAIIQGTNVQKGRHKTPRGNSVSLEGVRDGTGQVHFHKTD